MTYWRNESKAGNPVDARIINTSSGAGLMGSIGQGNYAAAKAGIAALTIQAAAEFGRYGVTVNAIAPSARTRMTVGAGGAMAEMMAAPEEGFDAMAPENVSPVVVWLGSTESSGVTGRVFELEGGKVSLADGWRHGDVVDKGDRWDPKELGPVVEKLLPDRARELCGGADDQRRAGEVRGQLGARLLESCRAVTLLAQVRTHPDRDVDFGAVELSEREADALRLGTGQIFGHQPHGGFVVDPGLTGFPLGIDFRVAVVAERFGAPVPPSPEVAPAPAGTRRSVPR